jgi:hypothetical protein
MPKITPTTNDALHSNGSMKISIPHEPLKYEQWGGVAPLNLRPIEGDIGQDQEPAKEVKPLKVALLGTAPSSRMLAPFNDPEWEIWVCSPGNQGSMPRVTRWFEIHGNMLWPENRHYGEAYIEWLRKQPFPIYMQSQEWVPHAKVFPKDEMVARFGRGFFTSSFAWMMALAISEGATEIALYGIDMASRDEYILQRPGFYFFKHEAEKLGIKVSAPNESDIMQDPALYGYAEVTPFGRKLNARKQEIVGRLEPMRQERAKIDHTITYLEGALEDLDYIYSIWAGIQS